ncbi:TSCPD domain-containing protein [Paraclostridium sordellii]
MDEIIETFEKIPCKNRDTSCPDQLATALKIYKKYILKD